MPPEIVEENQIPLFDLSGQEYNINWVDEKQPLFIPNNPAHWKAHKLQILIARLDRQAQNNPAQFNSKIYKDAVDEFEKIVKEISEAMKNGTITELDSTELAGSGDGTAAPTVGVGVTPSLRLGVSADNPLAG